MKIDEILNSKLELFVKRFENKKEYIKRQVHYNSVRNICSEILIVKNKKQTKKYKESIIKYLNEIESLSFPIDRLLREKLFHDFIFESGRYLMYKSNFKTNGSFLFIISLGLLIDIFLYFYDVLRFVYFIPITTIVLIIYGFVIKKKAIKEGRYFIRNW